MPNIEALRAEFDPAFFARIYQDRLPDINLSDHGVAFAVYIHKVTASHFDPKEDFSEEFYLTANSDVQSAVVSGSYLCGFEHWLLFGRSEGRACRPSMRVSNAALSSTLHCEDFERMLLAFDDEFFLRNYAKRFNIDDKSFPDKEDIFSLYLRNIHELPLDPCPAFSEEIYLKYNPDVRQSIRAGQYLCGFHHWVSHGRSENRVCARLSDKPPVIFRKNFLSMDERSRIRSLFNPAFYSYFSTNQSESFNIAFEHFLKFGLEQGAVPVDPAEFDEDFYVCYYSDVAAAKRSNVIPSGFYHYIISGCAEGRMPIHNVSKLLARKLGDAADPIGLERVEVIEHRLRPIEIRILERRLPVVNAFVPALDGDIMFGGYIAFLHFLCRLVEHGSKLRLIIMEDRHGSAAWFLRSINGRPRWYKAFASCEVLNATEKDEVMDVHPDDICIAYSCWTMFDAWSVAQHLNRRYVIFFIQEYEPVFHEYDSLNFVMASAYRLPHLPIFNSDSLRAYFHRNKVGVEAAVDSGFAFKHAIATLAPARATMMAPGRKRRLLCYARPEKHAARNLFEIAILALRRAISEGIFKGDWEFWGIGSLGREYEMDLPDHQTVKIVPRIPQDEYEDFIRSFDVGISLMWAPHPSVLPFELARAGVVTVTNEFEERDATYLSAFGTNLVTAKPSVDEMVEALRVAVNRAEDFDRRIEQSMFTWPTDWDEVFDNSFFENIFDAIRRLDPPRRQRARA